MRSKNERNSFESSFNLNMQERKNSSSNSIDSYSGTKSKRLSIIDTPIKKLHRSVQSRLSTTEPGLLTPPSSIGKKFFNSFRNSRNNLENSVPRDFTQDEENSIPKSGVKPNKKVPTPLPLAQPGELFALDSIASSKNDSSSWNVSSSYINKEQIFLNPKRKLFLEQDFLDSPFRETDFTNPVINENITPYIENTGRSSTRKNYSKETCVVCHESLRMALKGEKLVPMTGGSLAHYDCSLMEGGINNDKTVFDKESNNNNFEEKLISENKIIANMQSKRIDKMPSLNLEDKPRPISELTTPIDQVLKVDQVNENGFYKNTIKEIHQQFKKMHFFNESLDFEVSILPQFYTIDLVKNDKTLLLPYVLHLNNKNAIPKRIQAEISNEKKQTTDINEREVKMRITKKFMSSFPSFLTQIPYAKFKNQEIMIDMIDFFDVLTDNETYEPYLVIFLANIDYLFFISIDGNSSYSVDLRLLYKVIRLEDIFLIYSKSLDFPEISFKIPSMESKGNFVDIAIVLDKWIKVLKSRNANKSIEMHLQSFSVNLFDVVDHSLCCQKLKDFVEFCVNEMPGNILNKVINIANQKDLDFNYLLPTIVNENNIVNKTNKLASKVLTEEDEPFIICFVISTFNDVQQILREILSRIKQNYLVGFIIANGNSSFKYMGLVDSSWDGFEDFLENIISEGEKLEIDEFNIENMFVKLNQLLTMNGTSNNSYIDLIIFNDQEFENFGSTFENTLMRYKHLTIAEFPFSISSSNLENYMENSHQFTNSYYKLSYNRLSDVYSHLIDSECNTNKAIEVDLFINPDFKDFVSFKNLENAFGHKVFIENYMNVKNLQFRLKNKSDFQLLMVDLEIHDQKAFFEKLNMQAGDGLSLPNPHALIFYKLNNSSTLYKSYEVEFNKVEKFDSSEFAGKKHIQLELDYEEEEQGYLYEDSASTESNISTVELFITTPITANKEPMYLLRDIELQIITIIEDIFVKGISAKNTNISEIINYYYTIFFSYSKNIDIQGYSNLNFCYKNITEYIDCIFDILLCNDTKSIILLYDMLKFQYRNCIKMIPS